MSQDKIKVWFGRSDSYEAEGLNRQAAEALQAVGFRPDAGTRVLVKPNLLFADPKGLACSQPLIVRAACLYLLDCGCRITVADSPGFGRAARVAAVTGIAAALPAGLAMQEMGPKVKMPLSQGGSFGVARRALEADVILSLPRLKAHRMMRLSGAVKNLYGCVSGVEKALLHSKHGDRQKNGVQLFPSLMADLLACLPPCVALLDGIRAMHKSGPMNGEPLDLGLLAAGSSCAGLDTAFYTLLGQGPDFFPIWAELQRRGAPGAFLHELEWLGLPREEIDLSAFELPKALSPSSFNPARLLISGVKRAVAYIKN